MTPIIDKRGGVIEYRNRYQTLPHLELTSKRIEATVGAAAIIKLLTSCHFSHPTLGYNTVIIPTLILIYTRL